MSEDQDRREHFARDLELTEEDAAQVKGGVVPIEPGGDTGFSFGGGVLRRKRKKKKKAAKQSYPAGGGRPV